MSSVDSRTVITAEQLQKVPVSRNVTAAALLAPGAVLADSRYGNVASFGGASASENQYYINGFSVTNSLTGVGLITLPFDAIDQQQVLTGGYGAEYGRATGGVVNIVTKRGTNTWQGSAQVEWTPRSLMQSPKSVYLTNGVLYQDRSQNKFTETQYSVELGGPLIKDKLFIYGAADLDKEDSGINRGSTATVQQSDFTTKATRWLGKIDWNITDSHIVELTGLSDTAQENDTIYNYSYASGSIVSPKGTSYVKNYNGFATNATPGGKVWTGKYTGYITDDFTVTALYGKTRSQHVQDLNGVQPNCPVIIDSRPDHQGPLAQTGCALTSSQLVPGSNDKTSGWRLDLEYKLGSHDIRGGVDNYMISDYSGTSTTGGSEYTYHSYHGWCGQRSSRDRCVAAGHDGIRDPFQHDFRGERKGPAARAVHRRPLAGVGPLARLSRPAQRTVQQLQRRRRRLRQAASSAGAAPRCELGRVRRFQPEGLRQRRSLPPVDPGQHRHPWRLRLDLHLHRRHLHRYRPESTVLRSASSRSVTPSSSMARTAARRIRRRSQPRA